MNREKKVMEALKALSIQSVSDLKAAIKRTDVNISIMAAGNSKPERLLGGRMTQERFTQMST